MKKTHRASPKLPRQKGERALYFGLCIALGVMPTMAFAQTAPDGTPETPPSIVESGEPPIIASEPPAAGAAADEVDSKHYHILRYTEDWSYLSDPSKSKSLFDPLKFIPLNDTEDIYLTLFGDERIRNINDSTKTDTPKVDGQNLTAFRTDLGADLHVTRYFRSFVEFVSGYDEGSHLGAKPASFDNPADLLQFFIEPMGQIGNVDVGLRLGREVMKWGNGTVIDPNDFPNVEVAFDAIHPYAEWDDLRIDAFVSDSVKDSNTSWHDSNNPSTKLDGVYVVKKFDNFDVLGLKTNGTIEPFFFNYENDVAKYGIQTGRDVRKDYGLRMTAHFNGFDFDEEAISQGGTFANRDVDAWAYFTNQGYTFGDLPLTPRLGFQADGASGGDSKKGTTIQTYQPMFPTNNYISDMDFFAIENLIDFRPSVVFHFTPKISLQALYGFYYRENVKDAIYVASPNRAYASTATNTPKGAEIGEVPQVIFSWNITPQVVFTQYASTLRPSPSLVQAGGGKGDIFFATTLLFRF